jgi:hypothetical protein
MDRPGGGDSGQPFKQFPIDNASTPEIFKRYYETNRTSLDFPVRGGAISQLLSGEFGVISSTIDRERIEAFFKSAPRGKAFLEKQKGLQLTNPRTQVPNTIFFLTGEQGNVFLPVTNVYTPTNTLAQVQAMGTGAFFNRHGLAPTIYEDPRNTYAFIAGAPQNNTAATNRLSLLWATKILTSTQLAVPANSPEGAQSVNLGIDPALIDRMGISQFQDQIFNYPGGPGSTYGIGFTRIRRVTNTSITTLSQTSPDPNFTVNGGTSQPYSVIALTYQQLAEQNTRSGLTPVTARIQDFRQQTNNGNPKIPSSDYKVFNIANADLKNIGTGNPGAPTGRVSYTTGSNVGEDRLNMLKPFKFNSNDEDPWEVGNKDSNGSTNDIIKFAFECIDNSNPDDSYALIFRAFLEGQISDTNQADYNTFKYLGRGETFRTYKGFDRTIGFTFRMFAQSRQELLPMYQKLNHLISQVYPDYSTTYALMRGSVVKLTIGDYLYRTPGFLENVNVSIDNNTTPWEIVLNEENDVRQLPHMVTVQCSFKPIMDILPSRVTATNPFVPLIANKDNYINPAAITANERNQPVGTDLNIYRTEQAANT